MNENLAYLIEQSDYSKEEIVKKIPKELFDIILPGNTVILKPNWVNQSHQNDENIWECVITHPIVISAVLDLVIERLRGSGKVIIADSPETYASFSKILDRYPVNEWKELARRNNIVFEIIDLRDDEWVREDEITIERKKLPGDPRGNVEVNLQCDLSEFSTQSKSKRGYFGADYNLNETNEAHNGTNNLYRVSKSIIEGDVFINLPKLKTHKKGGITCSLKNLVGINTYKNFLPHHSEGVPEEFGDQFPIKNRNSKIEGPILAYVKQNFLMNTNFAKIYKHIRLLGKGFFGSTDTTIRSGNWYGNDTLWRMVLDLNKILFYANPDNSLKSENFDNRKKYISIVDAILAGDGNGPLKPDPKELGYIICGSNPAAVDATGAIVMGFNPLKIPAIKNAFNIAKYKICNYKYDDIVIQFENNSYNLQNLPARLIKKCNPHFGWKNHIER
jgi:uncharacterized protein (DUF362 family)